MKVLMALSGGVDSSVAAAELLDAGHEVVGITMRLWGGDSDTGCCSIADVDDARRARDVATQHGLRGELALAIAGEALAVWGLSRDVGVRELIDEAYAAAEGLGITAGPAHEQRGDPFRGGCLAAAHGAAICCARARSAAAPSPPACLRAACRTAWRRRPACGAPAGRCGRGRGCGG